MLTNNPVGDVYIYSDNTTATAVSAVIGAITFLALLILFQFIRYEIFLQCCASVLFFDVVCLRLVDKCYSWFSLL